MQDSGFVIHYPEAKRWGLGVAAFEIGAAYSRQDPIRQLGTPLLQKLVQGFHPMSLTAHIGVLHGHETLYIAKAESKIKLEVVTDVGVRLPAPLTATGRAILSNLRSSEVRAQFAGSRGFINRTDAGPRDMSALRALLVVEKKQNYAKESGFISDGYSSLAVSLADSNQLPIAAIGITLKTEVLSKQLESDIVRAIRRTAHQLEQRMGYR
jgi:DNA-binding IclR family transcriptional regulator